MPLEIEIPKEIKTIILPPRFYIDDKMYGNTIQQFGHPALTIKSEIIPYSQRTKNEYIIQNGDSKILITKNRKTAPAEIDGVLKAAQMDVSMQSIDLSDNNVRATWAKLRSTSVAALASEERARICQQVLDSWADQFYFKEEEYNSDNLLKSEGLRPPQIGAVHATLAHWKVCDDPATIVMPTGIGKTETMLALLVCQRLDKLLVVVPTDALRTQISDKFLTLGILKKFNVLGQPSLYPVVGVLKHYLKTAAEVEEYFKSCNVIVTTMNVVSGCSEDVQKMMSDKCSHLFVDEAHHISAPTWEKFRRFFKKKKVIQFTATPYRGDGKHIEGKLIFNYPLRKAQEEGYFKPINFKPIREYNKQRADESIAYAALEQLKEDTKNKNDHIIMARVDNIKRADDIHSIYRKLAPELNPLIVHYGISATKKNEAIQSLRNGESKIIVCVDMLGEGFDLPELKIAALYDMHKSLAITIQFTGRFTRTSQNIGDATIIANIADANVEENIRSLYAEDADWNFLLRRLSEGATGREAKRSEFIEGFSEPPDNIPLQNIFPKMSTVVYRTSCTSWNPEAVSSAIKERRLFAGPSINPAHKALLFITKETEPIIWGDIKDIRNSIWDLYLLHWDSDQGLLFINSSNKGSMHEEIAKAYIAGDETALMSHIEGKRDEPRTKPPYPAESGLYNMPTLVNNIETYYRIYEIANNKYLSKTFYSISGDVKSKGVFDLPVSLSISEVLRQTENHPNFDFFIQYGGGAAGAIYLPEELDKPIPGAASIIVYNRQKTDLFRLMEKWATFYAAENCDKCTPCRESSNRILEMVRSRKLNHPNLEELFLVLENTSFCPLGKGMSAPYKTLIEKVMPR